MKKICIIGAGHAFRYQYKALKDLGYKILVCDKDREKISGFDNAINDYRNIPDDYKIVLVSTPPNTHCEIIKYLNSVGKTIICEKPLVVSMEELDSIESSSYEFYNILHFSFGDEIEWFINSKYFSLIPNNIKVYINDPYIENNQIIDSKVLLNGSYLDETINPISAILRIYKKDIKFISVDKKYYEGDKYDYYSNSKFIMDDVLIDCFVNWNDYGDKSKYIDLYYDNFVLRLDSMNRSVINLSSGEILYKSDEERMYKHYINGFNDFNKIKENSKYSLYLNREILKGVSDV